MYVYITPVVEKEVFGSLGGGHRDVRTTYLCKVN